MVCCFNIDSYLLSNICIKILVYLSLIALLWLKSLLLFFFYFLFFTYKTGKIKLDNYNNTLIKIGIFIKSLREKCNLSHQSFILKLNLSLNTYDLVLIERGERDIDLTIIK